MCWGPTRKNWQEILQRHCADGKRARAGLGSSVSVGGDHWKPQFRLAKPPEIDSMTQYAGTDHNLCTGSLVRPARTDLQSALWAHKYNGAATHCRHSCEDMWKRQEKDDKRWISVTCFCKVHAWRIAICRVFAFRDRGRLLCACLILPQWLTVSICFPWVNLANSTRCSKCSPPDCLCLSSLSSLSNPEDFKNEKQPDFEVLLNGWNDRIGKARCEIRAREQETFLYLTNSAFWRPWHHHTGEQSNN